MKTQIRNGVFETNSSSMHSIAIRKEHGHVTEKEFKGVFLSNGTLHIFDDELTFGRYPFQILHTMMQKVYYTIACYLGDDKGYEPGVADAFLEDTLYPIIRKYIPDFKGFELDPTMPEIGLVRQDDPNGEVYCSKLPGVLWVGEEESPSGYALNVDGKTVPLVKDLGKPVFLTEYGCVDHQSEGLLQNFLRNHNISLEEFLTDSAYVVVIDGDECRKFKEYMDAGFIKREDFEEIITV